MSPDRLGLFDTRADRQQVRFSLAIIGLMIAAGLLILPVRAVRLPQVVSFIPTVDGIMFLGELITATLLYAQAAVFRSRALSVLASGYVFAAILLVPHALTFPGAFSPDGLLGAGVNTTAWISIIRRLAFPIAVILYVLLMRADLAARTGIERPTPRNAIGVLVAIALAAATTLLATIGHDLLPPYFVNRSDVVYSTAIIVQSGSFGFFVIATVLLFRAPRTVLNLWLLVSLAGWLIDSLVNMTLHARFTAGFYGLFAFVLCTHLIVMLALIAESNRLYSRLAISTAARNHEWKTRLMSLEAVAAAISHEIGQPLSAVITNATGGLNWLARDKPDTEMVRKALHETIDAGKRATDVMKSIRAIFIRKPDTEAEFDLNALVRETLSLLDRELAGQKVSVQLMLDRALPPIVADRVQIQQVLINLVTNAIESMLETRWLPRRIAIRSAPLDDHNVLLEVSDNGKGIANEEMPRIFDAFFTTKATGTGLGLSLCRTIVEEHGGSLWASPGEEHGATFHLRLPRSGLDAQ